MNYIYSLPTEASVGPLAGSNPLKRTGKRFVSTLSELVSDMIFHQRMAEDLKGRSKLCFHGIGAFGRQSG